MVKSSTNITKTNKIIPSRTNKPKHKISRRIPLEIQVLAKKGEWEQKINKHVKVRFHPKRPNTETRLSTM